MKYTDDKIQQQIEAYLNQDMNDFDRSKFEKLIHDDEELHDEVELQQATIEAIRNERVLALKAGLSQVNISLWSATLIEAAKVAAIVAGLGVASFTGYYFLNSSPAENEIQVVSSNQNEISNQNNISEQEQSVVKESPEIERPISPSFDSKTENATEPSNVVEKSRAQKSSIGFNPYKSNDKKEAEIKKSGVGNVDVEEPSVRVVTPTSAKDISLPEDGLSKKTSLENIHPEVVIKTGNRDKFHYQFSDSKLVLYADFGNEIYEVLELNRDNSKRLFLEYSNKFYFLDVNKTDISPLKEVNDKDLLQILSAYQKRKN